MKLKAITTKKMTSYSRTFQSMGKGLLLIKIENDKRTNAPFHYFFKNGIKPPLDVAMDRINGEIDYITLFLQDEKVIINNRVNHIEILDGNLEIIIDKFDFDNCHIYIEADFDISYSGNSILVCRQAIIPKKAIRISEETFILFSDKNNFAGIMLKQISELEIKEMNKSEVLDYLDQP